MTDTACSPKVSIVLPTFNRGHYLRETVASVMAQTFEDWELVIADDGSDVPTRDYLRGLALDARVTVTFQRHSGRPAVARNVALRLARGEYVAFLDSDDVWDPRKLSLQMAELERRPRRHWCYCAFLRVDADGRVLAEEAQRPWQAPVGQIFAAILLAKVSLRTPCIVARRDLIARVGAFDERLADAEDLDLWMRLALVADAAVVDEPLVQVRVAAGSYTSRMRYARADLLAVIEKLQALAASRWQPLLRRERARHAMRLAREYAEAGEVQKALATLRGSLRFSWPYARCWVDGARTLAGAWSARGRV
jgi:glycosyltransferase involved in cell wall biosynthesis